MSRSASRSRRSRVPVSSSQQSCGKAAARTRVAWRALNRSGSGSRVSTEYVSNMACPARAGPSSTRARRHAGWASWVGSRAATATLVSHAQRSPLDVIAKAAHVVIREHRTLDVAENRQAVAGVDRALVPTNRFDPQTGSVWNQFELRIRCDAQRDAQRLWDYHPPHSVHRHVHGANLPSNWQIGDILPSLIDRAERWRPSPAAPPTLHHARLLRHRRRTRIRRQRHRRRISTPRRHPPRTTTRPPLRPRPVALFLTTPASKRDNLASAIRCMGQSRCRSTSIRWWSIRTTSITSALAIR